MDSLSDVVKVMGIGGAGIAIVEYLIQSKTPGINEYICIDSDADSLQRSNAHVKILLGNRGTYDHAVGDIGTVQAMTWNERESISEALQNTYLVFIVAGLGGGTGTGATEVVAQIAHDAKALTVALVSTPFGVEKQRRAYIANGALRKIRPYVDCMAPLSLERYQSAFDEKTPCQETFDALHAVIEVSIQAITSIGRCSSLICVDFVDFKQVLEESKILRIGWTSAKANEPALSRALEHPFYSDGVPENRITFVSIIASPSYRIADCCEVLKSATALLPNAPFVMGSCDIDDRLKPGETKLVLFSSGYADLPHRLE
jgi:cell division protein FtsZ